MINNMKLKTIYVLLNIQKLEHFMVDKTLMHFFSIFATEKLQSTEVPAAVYHVCGISRNVYILEQFTKRVSTKKNASSVTVCVCVCFCWLLCIFSHYRVSNSHLSVVCLQTFATKISVSMVLNLQLDKRFSASNVCTRHQII